MSIDNVNEPREGDWTTTIQSLRQINQKAMGAIYVDSEPTEDSVPMGRFVIYDSGSVRRVYMRTGKSSVGYITLTMI